MGEKVINTESNSEERTVIKVAGNSKGPKDGTNLELYVARASNGYIVKQWMNAPDEECMVATRETDVFTLAASMTMQARASGEVLRSVKIIFMYN